MSCTCSSHHPAIGHDPSRLRASAEIVECLGRPRLVGRDIAIDMTPSGPSPAALARVARTLTTDWLPRATNGSTLRLLSLQSVGEDKDQQHPSERFLAYVYDYTQNRTLRVCGRI